MAAILHAIFVIDYQSFNHHPSLLIDTLHHPHQHQIKVQGGEVDE
jgi:hypothetical protein